MHICIYICMYIHKYIYVYIYIYIYIYPIHSIEHIGYEYYYTSSLSLCLSIYIEREKSARSSPVN